ncbi:MAG: carbonate dehydratase [Bryobacteraceae bacterium]|nr:carbonate dehydratase [Bryobacteraceae bacterium]
MESYKKLLLANKAWVQDRLSADANYFEEMAKDQKPEFLWIGCSDSRVPAEEVTGTDPGELFVHRNIANMVVHTDLNILSVLQYAVEVLKVKHIIVCGHYGCGGVKNALTRKPLGLINRWLQHIKDVYRLYSRELEAIADPRARLDRLVELNTIEQVQNLAQTSIVQRAWRTMNQPTIHGWIYDLHTGELKELAQMAPGTKLDDVYMFDYGDEPASDPGTGER